MSLDASVLYRLAYGLAAEVYLPDGRSLNHELVRRGMAWWYREFAPHDAELGRLAAGARQAKRGLRSQPNPTPPWAWRSGQGVTATAGVVGNKRSRLYHAPSCRSVAGMKAENRVEFPTAEEAVRAGYRKAGDCR